MFDHGVDPVVVEKYSVPPQYPPGKCMLVFIIEP